MAKTIKAYVEEITKALRANKLYNRCLNIQILSLASAIRNLEMANNQIDGLTETTVWETTRYGKKLAPHPAFRIAKESQELVTRQMKVLGLTAEELAGNTEDDPLVNLTKKLIKTRKQPTIINSEQWPKKKTD